MKIKMRRLISLKSFLTAVFMVGFVAALFNGSSLNVNAQPYSVPELMYYKFNGTGTTVPNLASSPVGTPYATILGLMTQGGTGQFGGGLIGSGSTSGIDYLNTGWATNLGTGSWTISLYLNTSSTTTTQYFFGDDTASSFRCFTGGVAGQNNLILRGGGVTDIIAAGGAQNNTPSVTHFVYNSAANEIRAYVNGVLVSTVAQTSVNVTGTGPFKVGGYSTNGGLDTGGVLDEFRMYNRALSAAEVAATWNLNLIAPTAANVSVSGKVLSQNENGISGATVSLVDSNGNTKTAQTNSFGYYQFEEIAAGETYILKAKHKRYNFAQRVIIANEEVRELNIVAQP